MGNPPGTLVDCRRFGAAQKIDLPNLLISL